MDNDRISFHWQSCGLKIKKVQNSEKNQKVRRKSEKYSNFRDFPDFSEDLAILDIMLCKKY
jgi:hypothetical protein